MKSYEVVQNIMTADQLRSKMIAEADIKLREVLSDVDPFWIKWSFWLEELDKKELKNRNESR